MANTIFGKQQQILRWTEDLIGGSVAFPDFNFPSSSVSSCTSYENSESSSKEYRCCKACWNLFPSTAYSYNQWWKGEGNSRCRDCVAINRFSFFFKSSSEPSSEQGPTLVCCACNRELVSEHFSTRQWMKGEGISRCKNCVSDNKHNTQRRNHAESFAFDFSEVFNVGAFRKVYKGRYSDGINEGKTCVAKIFWDKRNETAWFSYDGKVVDRATKIVEKWNAENFGPTVQVNQPERIRTVEGLALVEPFINFYKKFNTNTGYVFEGPYSEYLQALSHYSYHISGGQFVLCDLQGGWTGQCLVITDPVILSQKKRFGPTDLGRNGILQFFLYHECNQWCKQHWQLPNIPSELFYETAIPGTSMISL
uniref:Elongation factor 2 n=1 Tax=Tetraselmis sp. GSL018 TaxID=582737 RepID=A0A061S1R2_9CHLO|mmetsp:Transcript_23918/g.57003  ORF Transcript_23918/g.57003 Transcript_23918/m.57003 type:complete len:365 (-) Transcript_23918:128-1222(-)